MVCKVWGRVATALFANPTRLAELSKKSEMISWQQQVNANNDRIELCSLETDYVTCILLGGW